MNGPEGLDTNEVAENTSTSRSPTQHVFAFLGASMKLSKAFTVVDVATNYDFSNLSSAWFATIRLEVCGLRHIETPQRLFGRTELKHVEAHTFRICRTGLIRKEKLLLSVLLSFVHTCPWPFGHFMGCLNQTQKT